MLTHDHQVLIRTLARNAQLGLRKSCQKEKNGDVEASIPRILQRYTLLMRMYYHSVASRQHAPKLGMTIAQ
ncbi:hypothetical protein M378DRAFT_170564 [Amanita muscaria Koide BX008]|uniref:Uncharacterized protein n=1 Tax=Amanita muscaria (strain Koide BX008) TaxID=946122 RepID=A0A0C2SWJ2_AMAMK|nr:hypothetical protein M378DRAFT_170564 [Amanita muscaria Koide BX008]